MRGSIERRAMLKLCKIHACPNGTLGLHLSRAPWDPYPWVSGVLDGSNAYQAGVRSGDTVLELNGCDVLGQKISELAAKIQNHWERGGNFVTVLIWRNKTENSAINQQSLQKFAKCLQHIAQLLECPVCLEVVKPPGWQCCNGHVLCNSCRGRTVKCPICRVTLGPRGRCLLSDKLFTLLAESFPCDGVRNGNSSSDCPKDYNDCHETPLISTKIDSPPSSASSSPTLDKVHQRKQLLEGNTILEHLKEPDGIDDDNNQLAANGNSLDDNIVVLKLNLKSKKKNDFLEHGSPCQHRHHHRHHYHRQQQQQQQQHPHRTQHTHPRPVFGQQKRTFHCPTGKSSCSLLQNATAAAIIASNNSGPDPDDVKTLDCIWTQDVSRKPKGEEKIETLGEFITEWDVMSHLTGVHQISVAQHYATFGQVVRLQLLNTKSIPCITIQSERTWNQNKENFKNNVNVSVGGGCNDDKVQGHNSERRYKNSRTTSAPKNVQRLSTDLFFVACIPMVDDDQEEGEAMETEGDQEEEGLQNEMNDVNADTRGDTLPPLCLQPEFDDCRAADTAGAVPVFVGFPNGPCTGVIKTAKKSKSTYSQTTGHLIQDPRSEFCSTTTATLQARVNVERSPASTRSVCTNRPKVDACTWCNTSSSSSSSSSSTSSFSMSSSSYRCCSNTVTRQHAIFIWYFGSDCDVKNFQTVIECKRTGVKWTGCVHPLTESWSSIRRRRRGLHEADEQQSRHMNQFLVLNSMPDGGDNFFDIVIKIK